MAKPNSRTTLRDYCLRRLGAPVINIEVNNAQLDDRIDDALQKYRDYHFDGTEVCFYKILVTATDITNEYFTVPEDLTGITRIFSLGGTSNIGNLFNIRYQIHLNDLFNYSSASYAPYVMAMRHIETLEEIFVGQVPIRFNRHMNRLYVDMDWSQDIAPGFWIIADGYRVVDPDTYTQVWNDPWLKEYVTALFKRQWGEHLAKFTGTVLLDGQQFDGKRILDEANQTIRELEADLSNSYSLPSITMMN